MSHWADCTLWRAIHCWADTYIQVAATVTTKPTMHKNYFCTCSPDVDFDGAEKFPIPGNMWVGGKHFQTK